MGKLASGRKLPTVVAGSRSAAGNRNRSPAAFVGPAISGARWYAVTHAPSGEMLSVSARLKIGGRGIARGVVSVKIDVTRCRRLAPVGGYTSVDVSGWKAAMHLGVSFAGMVISNSSPKGCAMK